MARELIERSALTLSLKTYLEARGWSLIYREGFPDEELVVPTVAVHFMPTNKETLQLGNTDEKLFKRVVQFDAYMENEGRAGAVCDDIMDFAELESVAIVDIVQDNAIVGSLTCQNNDSIYSETFAPNLTDVKVKRWRGIVRAIYEAHYP
jgi:hypothetical protein